MKKGAVIVELGAGTGVFTKKILSRLPADGRLLAFEINSALARYLSHAFEDKRLVIIEDDAALIGQHLNRLNLGHADCVISGLPLADFKHEKREEILCAIEEALVEDGLYLQFQYFLSSLKHIKKKFDAKVIGFELRNVPPAFLYECRKKGRLSA